VLAAWGVLCVHNLGALPEHVGFNVPQHLAYVDYVRTRLALPLADEGWEMHQPPLYYVAAAAVTALAGRLASVGALRLLAFAAAAVHLVFVDACLRRLFPRRAKLQIVGLVFVAFLPLHLVFSQYVANDLFAAAFSSAGAYLLLRVLAGATIPTPRLVALGLCLGGAILSKLTAIAPVLAILVVLAAHLAPKNGLSIAKWTRSLGVVIATIAATTGFMFVRAWIHFGHPIVTSFDPSSGFAWWQDPGYVTIPYFTRLGSLWTRPFHAELGSFFDGLASTLFGDGTWAGSPATATRPPWNYQLMAAGYALSVVPAALIALGAAVAVLRWLRRPSPAWSLVLAIAAFTLAASIAQFLRFPYYCHVKASYCVGAAVALAALAVVGFDFLAARRPALGAVLGVALGVWAATAFASVWVRSDAAATLSYRAGRRVADKDLEGAAALYRRALAADPRFLDAELGLARTEARLGDEDGGFDHARHTAREHPDSAAAHRDLANFEARRGDVDAALLELGEALRITPDDPLARHQRGVLLLSRSRVGEAAAALRDALTIAPANAETHRALAVALARLGAREEAAQHQRMVELLKAQREKNARLVPPDAAK
jgi:tetratricopeptide (TPR) repeat protein